MHRVHALTCLVSPFTWTNVFWIFGLKIRLVRFCEKLTFLPAWVVFPQISHFATGTSFEPEPDAILGRPESSNAEQTGYHEHDRQYYQSAPLHGNIRVT